MPKAKGLHESWSRLASAKDADWYVVIQGNYAKIVRKLFDPPKRKHTPKNAISGFSAQSRFRMLKWIAKVDWQSVKRSRFITLTYPDEIVETTYKDRAVQRFLFSRHLERHCGRLVPLLWRTEWTVRKSGVNEGYLMPHHHILAFDCGFLANEKAREFWKAALAWSGHVDTDVRNCPENAAAAYYVGKYAAKLLHLDIAPYLHNMLMTGRQWGVTRRALIPMHPCIASRCLTDGEIALARHLGKEWFSRYGEFGEGGFTVLGSDRVEKLRAAFSSAIDIPPPSG